MRGLDQVFSLHLNKMGVTCPWAAAGCVVVHALPKQGFEFMAESVDLQDSDVLWIVKENLKKNRLLKNFPEEVESTKKLHDLKQRTERGIVTGRISRPRSTK